MQQNWISHESKGEVKQMPGREVRWLQTPGSTGGRYSSVCTCVYEPGARAKPAHSHPEGEETVYVVAGSGRVKIGDVAADIRPGSVFLFPQGVPHMVWNTGTQPLHIVCFYAPGPDAVGYAFHEEFDFSEFSGE